MGSQRDSKATESESQIPEAANGRVPVLLVAGSLQDDEHARGIVRIDEGAEIKRGPSNLAPGLWAIDDEQVSRRHARIQRTAAGFEIDDLGSKNGTYLWKKPVGTGTPLRRGALLLVGQHAAVFQMVKEADLEAIEEDQRHPFTDVATLSPSLARAKRTLRRLARTGEDILFTGETGVGKEVYARAVHEASGRKGPFVPINCAAVPRELFEGELFGFARGAHSQAAQSKPGLVEEAEGGTLFLDEISEMPYEAQAKLLRFLQTRETVPLGTTRRRRIDARVIAATNRISDLNLGLRKDLYMRFGPEAIVIPSLRRRLEDLPALWMRFLGERRTPSTRRSHNVLRALLLHPWPGNVRELEKVCTRAANLAGEARAIELGDLPAALQRNFTGEAASVDGETRPPEAAEIPSSPRGPGRRPGRPRVCREELECLVATHQGNVAEIARVLDRRWEVVWRWIKEYGIDLEGHR